MVTIEHLMHGHRAVLVGVLLAVGFVAIGVWGIVNLTEGDWFIGGLFIACALLGLPSLISTVRRVRREERRSSSPGKASPR